MNKDLTVGKPEKVLWNFCLPLFGSIIFQQLYNIADSFVAGKFIGENALAAVGNSYEITLIFIAFAFGCNIGSSVVVSRFFGAKKYGEMKTTIYTTYISSAILCLSLMLFGIFGASHLLNLINTPMEIFADSMLYLDIYIWGLPFLFFYNIITGIFSAMGDSKTPFKFLAFSSIANIIVDIIFVASFNMGVAGVAWATFLCQGISCILSFIALEKRLKVVNHAGDFKYFDFDIFKRIVVVAVPSILQQSFISVGNIIIQSVINGFGPGVIAGYAAAVKLNNLVITSFTTVGNGISTYTSQNIGADNLTRVREGFSAGIKLIWTLSIPIIVIYLFGAPLLVKFFINDPSDLALNSAVLFMRIVSPFYLVVSVKLVSDGILRGAALMKSFMTATFADLILRVVLAVVLAKQFGFIGIWASWPIGWLIGAFLSVLFYKNGPWKYAPLKEIANEKSC